MFLSVAGYGSCDDQVDGVWEVDEVVISGEMVSGMG